LICLFYNFSNDPKPFITLLPSDGKALIFVNGVSYNNELLNSDIDSWTSTYWFYKFVTFAVTLVNYVSTYNLCVRS